MTKILIQKRTETRRSVRFPNLLPPYKTMWIGDYLPSELAEKNFQDLDDINEVKRLLVEQWEDGRFRIIIFRGGGGWRRGSIDCIFCEDCEESWF